MHHRINSSTHQMESIVRTTLDIDDDLLAAARELARRERTTAGRIVSNLLRKSLTGVGPVDSTKAGGSRHVRVPVAGFRPFPARGNVITNDHIDALKDLEGI